MAHDMLSGPPARDFADEAGAEAALTSPEQSWLDGKIGGDGQTDPPETAVLAFLAEA